MGFGGGMMRPMFSENLSDFMTFSGENLNNIPNSSNGNCYVRTQTSFQSNYLDENGQPQREKYTSHQEFGVNDKNEKVIKKISVIQKAHKKGREDVNIKYVIIGGFERENHCL